MYPIDHRYAYSICKSLENSDNYTVALIKNTNPYESMKMVVGSKSHNVYTSAELKLLSSDDLLNTMVSLYRDLSLKVDKIINKKQLMFEL